MHILYVHVYVDGQVDKLDVDMDVDVGMDRDVSMDMDVDWTRT
jgi:hypothetical protein